MRITIRLYSALSRYRPASAPVTGPFEWETPDGATVALVVQELGIPPGLMRACAVNGEVVDQEHRLCPGDHLALVPASAGGSSAPVPEGEVMVEHFDHVTVVVRDVERAEP